MEISETSKSKYKVRKALKISILGLLFFLILLFVYEYTRITPRDVFFSNITSSSVTVTWNTKSAIPGAVLFKEGGGGFINLFGLGKEKFLDTRDITKAQLEATDLTAQKVDSQDGKGISISDFETESVLKERERYYTHHVVVSGLNPETEYTFFVGDEMLFRKVKDVTSSSVVKTSLVPENIVTPVPAYGSVKDAKGVENTPLDQLTAVTDAVILFNYLETTTGTKSNFFSSTMNASGNWYIDVSGAVDSEGQNFIQNYIKADNNTVVVELNIDAGPLGQWKRTDDSLFISPAEVIVLNDPLQKSDEDGSLMKLNSMSGNFILGVSAQTDSFSGYCGECMGNSDQSPDCVVDTLIERGCITKEVIGQENFIQGDGKKTEVSDGQRCRDVDGCTCLVNGSEVGQSDYGRFCSKPTDPESPKPMDPTKVRIGPGVECKDERGCYCMLNYKNNGEILKGAICSANPKGSDGKFSPVTPGMQCLDEDGCLCRQYKVITSSNENALDTLSYEKEVEIKLGERCVRKGDGERTVIASNRVCIDEDGCICKENNDSLVEKGERCEKPTISDGKMTDIRWNQTCLDEDGCKCGNFDVTTTEVREILIVKKNERCVKKDGRDGSKATIKDSEVCNDPDGCICLRYAEVQTGGSAGPVDKIIVGYNKGCNLDKGDGKLTPVRNGQKCGDKDGCTCLDKIIVYGSICEIDTPSLPKLTELCTSTGGTVISEGLANPSNNSSAPAWNPFCSCPSGKLWREEKGCIEFPIPQPDGEDTDQPRIYLKWQNYSTENRSKTFDGLLKALKVNVLSISAGQQCVAETNEGFTRCLCTDGVDKDKYIIQGQFCREIKSCRDSKCENEASEGVDICSKSGERCGHSEQKAPSSFLNIFNITKAYAQKQESEEYILDKSNGLLSGIEAGLYVFEVDGQEYFVDVSNEDLLANSGNVLIYIDKNGDDSFIDGIDQKVSDLAQTIKVSTIAKNYTYYLKPGFNFVSFPFLSEDEEIRTAAGLIQKINKESGTNAVYSISKFDGKWSVVGQNDEVYDSNDFQLLPGEGYVIKVTEGMEMVIAGQPVIFESSFDKAPVTLFKGWNLIGIYGSNAKQYTAKSLIQDVNAFTVVNFTADNVTKWDSNEQRYDGYQVVVDSGVEMEYGFDYPILQLNSYFVRVTEGKGNWQPGLAK